MYIRQRGKDGYCYVELMIDGQRYPFTFNGKKGMPLITKKREAKDYAEDLRRQIKTGVFFQNAELKNFAKFYQEIFMDYSRKHKTELSQKFDEYHGAMLVEAFGKRSLSQITPKMIEDYFTNLLEKKTMYDKPFAPSTLRKQFNILNHIFNMAIREKVYNENPCRYVSKKLLEKLPTWEKRERWLNKYPPIEVEDDEGNKKLMSEEERLFAAFSGYNDLAAFTHIVLNTGARPPKEVLSIKVEHINLSNESKYYKVGKTDVLIPPYALLIARGKNGKPRCIPLNNKAREVFSILVDGKASDAWLFAHSDGRPIKSFKKGWQYTFQRAQIADFRSYDLRHTFATRLLERGVHPYVISALLGHSQPNYSFGAASRITPGYAHATWDSMVKAVFALEQPVEAFESNFSNYGKITANYEQGVKELKVVNA